MESTKTCKLQGFHIVKPRTYPTTAITWATYLPGFEEQVFELLNKLVFGSYASTILYRWTLEMEVGSVNPKFLTDGWSLRSTTSQTMDVSEMSWQGAADIIVSKSV